MNARTHCSSCDPDKRKSKSSATYGRDTFCHRCEVRTRVCVDCGDRFEPKGAKHDRCDECFKSDASVGFCNRLQNAANDAAIRNTATDAAFDAGKLERIWARAVPLRDTIGAKYLLGRGCVIPPADGHLRFLPEKPCARAGFPPSLVALVTDAVTNKPMTLHFTKLAADGSGKAGTDRDRILLKGYPKRGGVIRLWPDESVTDGLAIAEGVETALSAAHAFSPVWATVDAGNMAALPVLEGVEALTIFADNDPAGLKAARACGQRWARNNPHETAEESAPRDVRLVVPRQGDVNDAITPSIEGLQAVAA